MYLEETGRIFVNLHHPSYPLLSLFLSSCCEPVCRTHHICEYLLNESSLSAASAEGSYFPDRIRTILKVFRLNSSSHVGLSNESPLILSFRHFSKSFLCSLLSIPEDDPSFCRFYNSISSVNTTNDVNNDALFLKTLTPLPTLVEAMITAEEKASTIRIVLQPLINEESIASERNSSSLRYFMVSRDRPLLQKIVEKGKNFLDSILIRGISQWIFSDFEHVDLEDRISQQNTNERETTASKFRGWCVSQKAAFKNQSKSRIVFKALIKDGCLRYIREWLFTTFSICANCSYDYQHDHTTNIVQELALREIATLRPYQRISLDRFRQDGRAHQGVIVLPCGAGKTLTGITAACITQRRTIVVCINVLSCLQWKQEFLRWTKLKEEQVTLCISGQKQLPGDIFITTYTMLTSKRIGSNVSNVDSELQSDIASRTSFSGKQTEDAQLTEKILRQTKECTWGLLILDEVHTALAHHFQEIINKVNHHCAIGLSATLLREDNRISGLRHLVGPKLYEANWLELTQKGYLANVWCAEVRCPLPPTYLREYFMAKDSTKGNQSASESPRILKKRLRDMDKEVPYLSASRLRRTLMCLNPYKIWCTQALLRYHGQRMPPDKVIIFCDFVAGVQFFAQQLGIPYMDGFTSEDERRALLDHFRYSTKVNSIILSRVGDTALDIPEASVIIQISGMGASRRQEAQRLGRILRPKPPSIESTSAFFYTLVSMDTIEVREAVGRQTWLRDQGFAYRILNCHEVLDQFQNYRQIPLCIGPPRWFYEYSISDKITNWVMFLPSDSQRIEESFLKGISTCQLENIPLNHHSNTIEKRVIKFNSDNAPLVFGFLECVYSNKKESSNIINQRLSRHRISRHCLPKTNLVDQRKIQDTKSLVPLFLGESFVSHDDLWRHRCLSNPICMEYGLRHLKELSFTQKENNIGSP